MLLLLVTSSVFISVFVCACACVRACKGRTHGRRRCPVTSHDSRQTAVNIHSCVSLFSFALSSFVLFCSRRCLSRSIIFPIRLFIEWRVDESFRSRTWHTLVAHQCPLVWYKDRSARDHGYPGIVSCKHAKLQIIRIVHHFEIKTDLWIICLYVFHA